MITSVEFDEVLTRFRNANYNKERSELTLKVKKILEKSDEYPVYAYLTATYASQQGLTIVDTLSREFLAGIIIGITLQKEYGI